MGADGAKKQNRPRVLSRCCVNGDDEGGESQTTGIERVYWVSANYESE